MAEKINNISQIIRSTEEYSDVCDMCRDEILLYPTISGRTNYTQKEVEEITLKRIIDKLQAKEQECEELKKGVIKQCPNCGEQYLNQIGAELYEECEALKKQLEQQKALTETYKACYRAKHNDVKDKLIRLKQEVKELKEWQEANQPTGICETCTAKSVEYADKCRIALVEIEYVTKELFLGVENKDRPYCEKILNIINKAKGK